MRSIAEIIRSGLATLRRFLRDPVGYIRELRVRRRRRKLVLAYAKVGQHRYDLGGFSSLLFAYDRITSEGLAVIVDGEFVWRWPDGDLSDVEGGEST
jgi:hypothetical protein